MRNILTILFFLPLIGISQTRLTGNPVIMRNVSPQTNSGESVSYEIVEANPAAVDTAIDGIGTVVMGDTAFIIGGWNASYGVPYTRNSIYSLRLSDYTTINKTQGPFSSRHSFGYGTGGTGYGYVVGGDWQPEATPQSRREVWRTTTNTTARNMTLQTSTPGWNDSIALFGFAIQPDSIAGVDTLFYAGGQKGYDLIRGLNPNVYRSVDAGATWSLFATNSRFFGGNQNGCFYWFSQIRKFIIIKGAIYDNDVANRSWADSVFLIDPTLTTYTYIGKLNPAIQYPQMCMWDNRVWIVCGNIAGANTSKVYTVNNHGVLTEMVITTPTPLHATSLAVDAVNDRLIIACGNLVRNVWYIRRQTL
jgi:hypothetical protein